MGALSNYLENKVLDHTLGTTAYTAPSEVYVALFTSDPGEDGSGTEVSGGAYARQSVGFDAASGGNTANSADITFPVATASWGTVSHIGLYDVATGGNLLWYGAVNTEKAIGADDQYKIPSGKLTTEID